MIIILDIEDGMSDLPKHLQGVALEDVKRLLESGSYIINSIQQGTQDDLRRSNNEPTASPDGITKPSP